MSKETMARSPRVMITLPPKTHSLLLQWAEKDGLSIATMAMIIIKHATDTEEKEGRLSVENED